MRAASFFNPCLLSDKRKMQYEGETDIAFKGILYINHDFDITFIIIFTVVLAIKNYLLVIN